MYKEAVRYTPHDHLSQATHLSNLGLALERRKDQNDLDQACIVYEEAANLSSASPTVRILAAVRAARLLADEQNTKASELYQLAVERLPEASPISLSMLDQEVALAGFAGLASEAAAVMLDQGIDSADVLKLLELGRGIIMGSILDIRNDLNEIPDDLVETYESIRSTLDPQIYLAQTGLEQSRTADPSTRHQAELKLASLVTEIRNREGFGNFRRPLNSQDLVQLAEHGPIAVINIDKRRCDALIVTKFGVVCQKLPRIRYQAVQNQVQLFRSSIKQIQSISKEIADSIKGFSHVWFTDLLKKMR